MAALATDPRRIRNNAWRRVWIGIAGTVLVVLLLDGFVQLPGRVRETREIATEHQTIVETMLILEQEIGYGGFIHNFKNAALRPESRTEYISAARTNVVSVEAALAKLAEISSIDQSLLDDVSGTFDEYFSKLPIVANGDTLTPDELDDLIRVRDDEAVAALRIFADQAIYSLREREEQVFDDFQSYLTRLFVETILLLAALTGLAMAERTHLRLNLELAASAERDGDLRSLIELSDMGIVVLDKDRNVLHTNGTARSFISAPARTGDALLSDLADRAADESSIEVLNRLRQMRSIRQETVRFTSDDGTIRHVIIAAQVIREDGKARGYMISLRDETSTVIARTRIGNAHRFETLGRMTGGLLHDFRKMLVTSLLALETFGMKSKSDDPLLQSATKSLVSGEQILKRLVKMAAGDTLEDEPAQVREVLEDLRILTVPMIGTAAKLTITQPDFDRTTLVPQSELLDVLVNLLMNALEAMEHEGKLDGNVNVWVEQSHGLLGSPAVTFVVADDGPGMTDKQIAAVLSPRPHGGNKVDSMGFGLSNLRAVAAQSGGEMQIARNGTRGLRVCLTVPTRDGRYDQETTGGFGPLLVTRSIVICDPNRIRHHVLVDGMRRAGANVIETRSAIETEQVIDGNDIDFIIVDPNFEPEDAVSSLARKAKLANVPIIFLSTRRDAMDMVNDCVDLGHPDGGERLLEAIRRAVVKRMNL